MKKTLKLALVISIVFSLLIGNVSALAVNIINETSDNQNKTVTTETNTAQSNEDNEITVENNTSTDNNPETSERPSGKDEAESESKERDNTTLDTESSIFDDEKSDGIVDQILKNLMASAENDGTPKAGEDDVVTESFGKLYVSVDLRLPQANQNKLATSIFNVILKKDNTEYKPEFYKGASQVKEETKLYYTFNNVKAGTYTLEISGKGYVPYTHEVIISGNTISELSLTNGYKENTLDILEGNQIGVLAIGDVTSDGYIVGYNLDGTVPNGQHANDEEKMIGVLDKGTKDSSCDLNADGEIDIIDLSYISINKNKERTVGKILESVDISSADVKVNETTKIQQGEVEYILQNNDKYVTLAPKDPNADISAENAIEITLDLGPNVQPETQEITIAPSSNPENNIEGGTITIELDSGETIQAVIDKTEIAKVASYGANIFRPIATVNAKIEPDGTISVDLGEKVAVKKITIKVTATKSNKFADIAKVEFLNGNIDRVPAPELAIPKITHVDASTGQSFTVTWENMVNVTGYEVKIRAMTKNSGEQTDIYSVDGNSITISDFHGAVEDNIPTTYYVSVQSVNGEWRSGFSDETPVTVDAVSKPGAPDNLTLKGGVKKIEASWKKMNATDSYRVYYRKYDGGNYIEATAGITLKEPRFTIENLEDAQRYQVYVIGVNRIGDSDRSNVAVAETSNITPAQMPNYKLINTPNGKGQLSAHIVNVTEKGKRRNERQSSRYR